MSEGNRFDPLRSRHRFPSESMMMPFEANALRFVGLLTDPDCANILSLPSDVSWGISTTGTEMNELEILIDIEITVRDEVLKPFEGLRGFPLRLLFGRVRTHVIETIEERKGNLYRALGELEKWRESEYEVGVTMKSPSQESLVDAMIKVTQQAALFHGNPIFEENEDPYNVNIKFINAHKFQSNRRFLFKDDRRKGRKGKGEPTPMPVVGVPV